MRPEGRKLLLMSRCSTGHELCRKTISCGSVAAQWKCWRRSGRVSQGTECVKHFTSRDVISTLFLHFLTKCPEGIVAQRDYWWMWFMSSLFECTSLPALCMVCGEKLPIEVLQTSQYSSIFSCLLNANHLITVETN